MIRHPSAIPAVGFVLAAVVALTLMRGLPLDGYFTGDSGVKLIAARQAIAHPARPLQVDLLRIGSTAFGEYLEPFFRVHGDHAHAITSPIFPVLAAPFVAMAGLAGGHVVPLACFLLLIPATAVLGVRARMEGSGLAFGAAIATLSPMLFYGLEFWEHGPAVACATLSAVLALTPGETRTRLAVAGGLAGLAVMLRPETSFSVLVIVWLMATRSALVRHVPIFGAGAVIAALPLLAYNWAHFGTPMGWHATANVATFDDSWLSTRTQIARLWLGNWSQRESLWRVCPFAALALLYPRFDSHGRALWLLVVVPVIGVLLTTPNDGGGQWGPRYLLPIIPPLVLLSVDAATRLWRRLRDTRGAAVAGLLIALFVVQGVFATRASYRELRGSKRIHAEIARAISAIDEDPIVTNVWWLDQLASTGRRPHTFLYVSRPEGLSELAEQLSRIGIARFAFVQSLEGPTWRIAGLAMGYQPERTTRLRHRGLEVSSFLLPQPGQR